MNLSVSWRLSPLEFMLDLVMGMGECLHMRGELMLVIGGSY
jgi:hypothetical protein